MGVEEADWVFLDDSAIERLRKYIHSISAIDLHDSDIPLIKHLFQQLADEHGLETPDEVLAWLKLKKDPSVTLDWLNSVFTSEMTFFQDFAYFKFIRHICMPHLLAKKHEEKAITILCVGSGYGQEPYSLAIMLNQAIPELRDWTISIIAADPSSSRLNRCQQGVFTSQEIEQGTPKKLVETNFEELVKMMVNEDLERWERWKLGEHFPWDAINYPNENQILSRMWEMDRI